MKTPQVPHGVIDILTDAEVTTPLGIPRHGNPYKTTDRTEEQQDWTFLKTLGMFHGSELPPVKHICVSPKFGVLLLSEGTHYFREYGGGGNGCHWLFDIYLTEVLPLFKKLRGEALLVLNISVKDNKAMLTAKGESPDAVIRSYKVLKREDYDGVVWKRKIDFTDLCDMEFNLWMFENGHIIIPAEY
tara:strand:+ start:93 stop:653 length:561 start_codon:yes stop_codon:yes gene_type:complete